MNSNDVRGKNIIIYGTPRSGSTLFLKLMEQALEQTGDCIPIVLKEFFAPAKDYALDDKLSMLNKHDMQTFLLKLFSGDIVRHPELSKLLKPSKKI